MGRQALQMASWIVVVGGVLLLFLEPGTAEFIITAASVAMGTVFGIIVWFWTKRSMK